MVAAPMKLEDSVPWVGGGNYDKPRQWIKKKKKDITLLTKILTGKAMVFTVAIYRCESWTKKKAEHQRIHALKLWFWKDFCESLGQQGDQIGQS